LEVRSAVETATALRSASNASPISTGVGMTPSKYLLTMATVRLTRLPKIFARSELIRWMISSQVKLPSDAKGISCNKAALEIGLSNATPTKWKKTGATPSSDTLQRIADYFQVPITDLLGITNSLDGMIYKASLERDQAAAARLIEKRSIEKEKPAGQMASGLRDAGYDLLTPDEKKVVDSLIEQLLSLRSRE